MTQTMFIATLETTNFYFESFGESKAEALRGLRLGWIKHRRLTDADDTWDDVEESASVREVKIGQCWRDRGFVL